MSTDAANGGRTGRATEQESAAVVPPVESMEYAGFLADVTEELETRVEPWRVELGEAAARWRLEGYATGVLERAMTLPSAPDVQGLLAAFSAAVRHLQTLERQAVALDPVLGGHALLRNPACIREAEQLVDGAGNAASPVLAPVATSAERHANSSVVKEHAPVVEAAAIDDFFRDTEKVIWEWPDLSGRLMEEFR